MSNIIDLSDKLDFSEKDMTAPNQVISEIVDELPKQTGDIVCGRIDSYNGSVTSFMTNSTSNALASAFSSFNSPKYNDIQDSLGKIGEEEKKYVCYLYTPCYPKFKYRMFFMKYGIASYPVEFTLEESIARDIRGKNSNYFITCDNREEVEALMINILTSKKVISIMQELIQINQSRKDVIVDDSGE